MAEVQTQIFMDIIELNKLIDKILSLSNFSMIDLRQDVK